MVLPGAQFSWWAKLTSIFLVISFRLEQQAWFRVCVVPVVPITFSFIIPLTWCRRRLITSSGNLSTNVSWSSSTFWALPGYQSNSWWEIQSLPLDDLCYHRQYSCLPQHKLVHIVLEIHPFWHVDGLLLSPSATPSSFPCWNCMTYFLSCFRWILGVSKVWPLLENHVNDISKHVNGTPIFNRNIWSTMLNFIYHLS